MVAVGLAARRLPRGPPPASAPFSGACGAARFAAGASGKSDQRLGVGGQASALGLSARRVQESMSLLERVSDDAHPGHRPGRFAGFGPEFDGMDYDASTGRWALADAAQAGPNAADALADLGEADQALITKFESSGGLALTLGNAFRLPDRLRREGRHILRQLESADAQGTGGGGAEAPALPSAGDEERRSLLAATAEAFQAAGIDFPLDALDGAPPAGRAVLMLHAADLVEEREAVMRNVWSDVDFQCGDAGNAELVGLLERQFSEQLVRTTEARWAAEAEAPSTAEAEADSDGAGLMGASRVMPAAECRAALAVKSTRARRSADAAIPSSTSLCGTARTWATWRA